MNPILYESKRIIIESGDMRIVARKASSLFSGGARQGARVEGGVSPSNITRFTDTELYRPDME